MINLNEIVDIELFTNIPIEHQLNITTLYHKISQFRAYAKMPFIIRTPLAEWRGYRTWDAHCQIYEDLMKKTGKKIKIPVKSQHLIGAAVDIADPTRELQKWVLSNLHIIEKLDLYFEHFDATPGWCHAALYPPESGSRFFMP